MKISFGNMTVELNIFNINNQPLDYGEIHHVCLIEEITDEFSFKGPKIEYFTQDEDDLDLDRLIGQDDVVYEPSLEDPEMECFAPFGGDLDLSKLFQHAETMHEPSMEDPEMECFAQCGEDMDFYRLFEPARAVVEPSMEDIELESFAQLGDNEYFDEVVELVKAIFDPISEMQLKCGETTELSFPTTYSLAFEPPDLISESKWVGPIHLWPRWPNLIVGRKKDNECFFTQIQTIRKGCNAYIKMKTLPRKNHFPPPFFEHSLKGFAGHFFMLIDYASYDHYPFDPSKS
jgi:hypothetical protein